MMELVKYPIPKMASRNWVKSLLAKKDFNIKRVTAINHFKYAKKLRYLRISNLGYLHRMSHCLSNLSGDLLDRMDILRL